MLNFSNIKKKYFKFSVHENVKQDNLHRMKHCWFMIHTGLKKNSFIYVTIMEKLLKNV